MKYKCKYCYQEYDTPEQKAKCENQCVSLLSNYSNVTINQKKNDLFSKFNMNELMKQYANGGYTRSINAFVIPVEHMVYIGERALINTFVSANKDVLENEISWLETFMNEIKIGNYYRPVGYIASYFNDYYGLMFGLSLCLPDDFKHFDGKYGKLLAITHMKVDDNKTSLPERLNGIMNTYDTSIGKITYIRGTKYVYVFMYDLNEFIDNFKHNQRRYWNTRFESIKKDIETNYKNGELIDVEASYVEYSKDDYKKYKGKFKQSILDAIKNIVDNSDDIAAIAAAQDLAKAIDNSY